MIIDFGEAVLASILAMVIYSPFKAWKKFKQFVTVIATLADKLLLIACVFHKIVAYAILTVGISYLLIGQTYSLVLGVIDADMSFICGGGGAVMVVLAFTINSIAKDYFSRYAKSAWEVQSVVK